MKNRLQNGTFQIPKNVTVIDIGMHSVRERRDGSESAVETEETKKEKRGTGHERIGESNSPGDSDTEWTGAYYRQSSSLSDSCLLFPLTCDICSFYREGSL